METSWQDVALDAIKILGPAIITAIAAYKTATVQLKIKLKELEKNTEFKAREKIFDFHKEKFNKLDEAIKNLNETLGFLAGMSLSDRENEFAINDFVAKYLTIHINAVPFDINQIIDELLPISEGHLREFEKLQQDLVLAESLKKPITYEQINDVIVKLIGIYGFTSYCSKILVEREALQTFDTYTKPNT